MKNSNRFVLLLSFFIVTIFNCKIMSQEIRPVKDDVGFCWTADEMNTLMKYLTENDSSNFSNENLVAAISPHDDYLYAGLVYAPLYKLIKTKEVVIFGVTHGAPLIEMNDPRNILILDNYDLWKGPYKNVEPSSLREKIKNELDTSYYVVSNKAHSLEHSIEALIPLLQYYNRDIKITPLMVTKMPIEKMEEVGDKLTDIIVDYIKTNNLKLGEDIFFLISNDANHYGKEFNNIDYGEDLQAHDKAIEKDKRITDESFNGEITKERIQSIPDKIWVSETNYPTYPLWCGRYPIVFGLTAVSQITNKLGLGDVNGKVFKYSDTFTGGVLPVKGTTLGTTSTFSLKHWVGFLSAGFYLK